MKWWQCVIYLVLKKKEDTDISIENNVLTISETVNKMNEVKEENMHQRGRYVGRFDQTIPLPTPVSDEGVTANYKNGVLEVHMPKQMKKSQRKIDIQFH